MDWQVQHKTHISPRSNQLSSEIPSSYNRGSAGEKSGRVASRGQGMSLRVFDDKESIKRSVSKDYAITEKLGMGAFGVVKKGKNLKTGKDVAIKCIRKADCKPDELRTEVRLLRRFKDYPGVVHLEDVYETRNNVNIIMECIMGGELFDAIIENEYYAEKDAAELVRQIVTTVEHIHSQNVVHRDLKPENLLFAFKGSNVLKLIDFGIAAALEDGKHLYEVVGSRTYMAPEIDLRCGYGKPVDMYAVGVIMYILLCGYPPFDFDQGIYELAFGSPEWDDITIAAKEIITNLLSDDPSRRYTASQLKINPWVGGNEAPETALTNNIHNTIRNYMTLSKMRTRVGGVHNRRMSFYGLFNISRQNLNTPSSKHHHHEKVDGEAQALKALKQNMRNQEKAFDQIKDSMKSIKEETDNDVLSNVLEKSIEDINFYANAYKQLTEDLMPTLNKAISNCRV